MLDTATIGDGFEGLLESPDVSRLDLEFGRLLRRLDADAGRGSVLQMLGVLVSSAVRRGQSRIALTGVCGSTFPGLPEEQALAVPALAEAEQACAASPLVGDGSTITPLVLDDAGRLALYRYWRAERRLARCVANRLRRPAIQMATPALQEQFCKLFTEPEEPIDWQAVAAAGALRHSFTVIAGGPGTGKTTTVVKLMALLLSAAPDQRILLAAPTGKAAKRLGTSIATQALQLDISERVRGRLPTQAKTLHRLLRYQPHQNRYRHDADRPLNADVLIIDECSMVDVLLFEAVIKALPERAHLILLGDPDQLPSIGAGYVFGDLYARGKAEAYSPAFADYCRALSGQSVPQHRAGGVAHPLNDAVVTLRKNYRFNEAPGISRLAVAIRDGDADGIEASLRGRWGNVRHVIPSEDARTVREHVMDHAVALCRQTTPFEAMAKLEELQVLCATYGGDGGVHRMNRLIESELLRRGERKDTPWYHARPVLVTTNDYGVGLFNGDVGLCWDDGGRMRVWFDDGAGNYRQVPPAKLPAHQSAWAMTIHKSQGSEFNEVVLVLPEDALDMLTRELLYTGVTRARERLLVVGRVEHFVSSALKREARVSGVGEQIEAWVSG